MNQKYIDVLNNMGDLLAEVTDALAGLLEEKAVADPDHAGSLLAKAENLRADYRIVRSSLKEP